MWISIQKKSTTILDEQIYNYLTLPIEDFETTAKRALGANFDRIDDEFMKILNLGRQLLHSILPFILRMLTPSIIVYNNIVGKINRVTFGLLSPEQIQFFLDTDPNMPRSRTVTSIPFIGKDVPSQRSEFSHPGILKTLLS